MTALEAFLNAIEYVFLLDALEGEEIWWLE